MVKRFLAMWMWLRCGQVKSENSSLPVTVRVLKTRMLKLPNNKHARVQNKARSFVNETVKMEPLGQKLRKHLLRRQHVLSVLCLARKLHSSKASNTKRTFQLFNLEFRRFLVEVSICCTMEIYNEGSDISSCRNMTYWIRIFIIFILKTTSIGSHVGKKLRSRLIHTLPWLNFDYHWLCVWFGSCENRRLTQSRSSGVLHGWPGVKNASAAPNKISRT